MQRRQPNVTSPTSNIMILCIYCGSGKKTNKHLTWSRSQPLLERCALAEVSVSKLKGKGCQICNAARWWSFPCFMCCLKASCLLILPDWRGMDAADKPDLCVTFLLVFSHTLFFICTFLFSLNAEANINIIPEKKIYF